MPKGDRTGPLGAGPMSGRRAGLCRGFNAPGCTNGEIADRPRMNGRYRCGHGHGPAFGNRGWRQRFHGTDQPASIDTVDDPVPSQFFKPAKENAPIMDPFRALQSELSEINTRLKKIEEKKK